MEENKNELMVPELSENTYLAPTGNLTIFKEDDIHFLQQNKQSIAKVYKHTWMWRTDAQKRSIISDYFYPTAHSKFHQAILEQKVQLDQALQLARGFEDQKLNMQIVEVQLEQMEKKIEEEKDPLEKRILQLELKKKEIAYSFMKYEIANTKTTMEYRMREVKGWQKIEDELIEVMRNNGMTEEQIWSKEAGEIYNNFFMFLNNYMGVKQSTDSAEVNNLTSLALHAIKEAIQAGIIKDLVPRASDAQKQIMKELGFGQLVEQFDKK